VKSPADTQAILAALSRQHPDATTELQFRTPFELLVATILSAQATDAGVNRATPALFARYPDAAALAAAVQEDVEELVRTTGFFRQKARAIIGMARGLVERHGGSVPASMEALVKLPGVGRKTANVVLGHALGIPGLPVDRHVLRVSNRIGIATSDDPERVEQQLTGALPPDSWTRSSDTLILHGRRVCMPKPQCEHCAVGAECDFRRSAQQVERTPAARAAGKPSPKAARTPPQQPARKTSTRPRRTGRT